MNSQSQKGYLWKVAFYAKFCITEERKMLTSRSFKNQVIYLFFSNTPIKWIVGQQKQLSGT